MTRPGLRPAAPCSPTCHRISDDTMAPHSFSFFALRPVALAAAAAGCMTTAHAQTPAPPADAASASLPRITVTTPASPPVAVGGWGDLPLSKLPMQAQVYGT